MELIADGANVVLHAATGSGKTLAFLVPLLARLTEGAGLQALVVAPSQELAVQLAAEAQRLHAEPASVLLALSTDAEGEREQEARLHAPQPRVQLVVGTANRLLALLGRPRAKPLLRDLRTVVLDEVDALLPAAAAAAADGGVPFSCVCGYLPSSSVLSSSAVTPSLRLPLYRLLSHNCRR